jgi:hypothetical protein
LDSFFWPGDHYSAKEITTHMVEGVLGRYTLPHYSELMLYRSSKDHGHYLVQLVAVYMDNAEILSSDTSKWVYGA